MVEVPLRDTEKPEQYAKADRGHRPGKCDPSHDSGSVAKTLRRSSEICDTTLRPKVTIVTSRNVRSSMVSNKPTVLLRSGKSKLAPTTPIRAAAPNGKKQSKTAKRSARAVAEAATLPADEFPATKSTLPADDVPARPGTLTTSLNPQEAISDADNFSSTIAADRHTRPLHWTKCVRSLHASCRTKEHTKTKGNTRTLRIGQINLNGSRAATAQLRQDALVMGLGILLIQEPYLLESKVVGYQLSARVVHLHSRECRAAIIVLDPAIGVQTLRVSSHVVAIEINWNGEVFRLLSVYAPPSISLGDVLSETSELLCGSDQNIVIGGDFNARNSLWGPGRGNDRGDEMLDFISSRGLHVLNDPTSLPTFETSNGKSWIDLTLVSGRALSAVHDWEVSDQESCSDHRLLRFDVRGRQTQEPGECRGRRYNIRSAPWATLSKQFGGSSFLRNAESILREKGTEAFVDGLTAEITEICDNNIPVKSARQHRSAPWWKPGLGQMRHRVRALRKRFQRTAAPDLRWQRRLVYAKEQGKYKRALLAAKTESWREFCSRLSQEDTFGIPYRLAAGRALPPLQLCSLVTAEGSSGGSEDTIRVLLETLFPPDTKDTPVQCGIRKLASCSTNSTDDLPFTETEISDVIRNLPRGKAPGLDCLNLEIIAVLHQEHPHVLTLLYNECLRTGSFPRQWKTAQVVLFNKVGKSPHQARSYRPICLLPVLGKILDKLVSQRIMHHCLSRAYLSQAQFGFFPGKSTTLAVRSVLDAVVANRSEGKYTSLISLDIEGAFDNVWWPGVMQRLRESACPGNLFLLVADYLRERKVVLYFGEQKVERRVERGCPQGSCSGPLFWNLIANSALNLKLPEGVTLQAYADDFLLLVSARSRQKLEEKGNAAVLILQEWAELWKLSFNDCKTVALTFAPRGSMARKPLFKQNGHSIRHENTLLYLGIVIDERLTFLPHLERVKEKVTCVSHRLATMARKTWGLRGSILRDIYERCLERIIVYGAGAWWKPTCNVLQVRKLDSIQRVPLLLMCRAYRTVSTAAMRTIAGIPPIAMTVNEEAVLFNLKIGRSATHLLHDFDPSEVEIPRRKWDTHPAKRSGIPTPSDRSCCDLQIFTDGSKKGQEVGGAFCVYSGGAVIYHRTIKLNGEATIFQAEAMAIKESLLWILESLDEMGSTESVRINTDSLSVARALQNPNRGFGLLGDTQDLFKKVQAGRHVELAWVKAHAGIDGNEHADRLAKAASITSHEVRTVPLSLQTVKGRLAELTLARWQEMWEGDTAGRHTFRFLPKVGQRPKVLDFHVVQLLSGHGKFPQYLHKVGVRDASSCICGEGYADAMHFLTNCPLVADLSCKLWEGLVAHVDFTALVERADKVSVLKMIGKRVNDLFRE